MDIKQLSGIDALYYFAETNESYDLFYIDLFSQITEKKEALIKEGANRVTDFQLEVDGCQFKYLGNAEGFHWLEDEYGFYRIGFKDQYKHRTLNNIRVQLSATGIYTIGIKSLLELINNDLLEEITTGVFPITRMDLNAFVQHDLSNLKKSAFVSRKKRYTEYMREIGNARTRETLYIGKSPFLLRIYNKGLEMSKSRKEELMEEYFQGNGFSLDEPIFNVEFEMHRQYLKYFSINTVDAALPQVENLFKDAMEKIRLVDLDTISDGDLNNKNKYKAQTDPLWETIRNQYSLTDFYQTTTPLERIKKPQYAYTYEKAIEEHFALGRKAKMLGLPYDAQFLDEVHEKVQESFEPRGETINLDYIDVIVDNKPYRLHKGELFSVVDQKPLSTMSDLDLMSYYTRLTSALKEGTPTRELKDRISIATKEMERRKLLEVPF